MPLVASFDGVNRRIYLDASVAGTEWDPLDVFIEYLTYRRDNHQFRGFEPLIKMIGGEPKSATASQPRSLQMLTDRRDILTKIILPDTGPYRTKITGEISTDKPNTDPEPFDISMMTTAVIVDYKPPEAEIIKVSTGSGLTQVQNDILVLLLDIARSDEEKNVVLNKFFKRHKDTKAVLVEKDYNIDGNSNETLIEPV